jgi:hypothetical protein
VGLFVPAHTKTNATANVQLSSRTSSLCSSCQPWKPSARPGEYSLNHQTLEPRTWLLESLGSCRLFLR